MPAEMPDTPSQAAARSEFDAACRDLSGAAVRLKDAQANYDRAWAAYNIAYGAAKQAGVLP